MCEPRLGRSDSGGTGPLDLQPFGGGGGASADGRCQGERPPPEGVPPDICAWFWESLDDFKPGECKSFVDLVAEHSPFRVLTTSQRVPREITDPDVHDRFKEAAEYARSRGLSVVLDLDVHLAREAFQKSYPDELQEMLRIRAAGLVSWAGQNRPARVG